MIMRHHVAALRHRAFVVKLALRRVAGFYNDMKRARLGDRTPDLEYYVVDPKIKVMFDDFREMHKRLETTLFNEMVRLSVEAEKTVNAYARARYGFAPGDQFQMGYPNAERPVTLKVHKVFLQSGTESDVRVDASLLEKDGARGARWDVYMKGPGEFQFDKMQPKEQTSYADAEQSRTD